MELKIATFTEKYGKTVGYCYSLLRLRSVSEWSTFSDEKSDLPQKPPFRTMQSVRNVDKTVTVKVTGEE